MSSPPRARSNPILAFARVTAFVLMTCVLWVGLAIRCLGVRAPEARVRLVGRWINRWARWGCRVAGIRVSVRGKCPSGGVLLAPNHTSYCDILALSSATPCFFVPKAEIGSWPAVGRLLRFLEMPFVSRRQSRELFEIIEKMETMFENGGNVCVFLEGTTTGGDRVLPARPALLKSAIRHETPIVPVGLAYSSANPRIDISEDVAYWKNHVFLPHVWRLFGLRGARVEVRFGEPVTLENEDDRREVGREIRARILTLLDMEDTEI